MADATSTESPSKSKEQSFAVKTLKESDVDVAAQLVIGADGEKELDPQAAKRLL